MHNWGASATRTHGHTDTHTQYRWQTNKDKSVHTHMAPRLRSVINNLKRQGLLHFRRPIHTVITAALSRHTQHITLSAASSCAFFILVRERGRKEDRSEHSDTNTYTGCFFTIYVEKPSNVQIPGWGYVWTLEC